MGGAFAVRIPTPCYHQFPGPMTIPRTIIVRRIFPRPRVQRRPTSAEGFLSLITFFNISTTYFNFGNDHGWVTFLLRESNAFTSAPIFYKNSYYTYLMFNYMIHSLRGEVPQQTLFTLLASIIWFKSILLMFVMLLLVWKKWEVVGITSRLKQYQENQVTRWYVEILLKIQSF